MNGRVIDAQPEQACDRLAAEARGWIEPGGAERIAEPVRRVGQPQLVDQRGVEGAESRRARLGGAGSVRSEGRGRGGRCRGRRRVVVVVSSDRGWGRSIRVGGRRIATRRSCSCRRSGRGRGRGRIAVTVVLRSGSAGSRALASSFWVSDRSGRKEETLVAIRPWATTCWIWASPRTSRPAWLRPSGASRAPARAGDAGTAS